MWNRKPSKYLLLVLICLIMVLMLVSVVYGRPFRKNTSLILITLSSSCVVLQ